MKHYVGNNRYKYIYLYFVWNTILPGLLNLANSGRDRKRIRYSTYENK